MKKFSFLLLITIFVYPTVANAVDMYTKAPYAFMIDYETGQEILSKRADEAMAPASMSKLMTVYIILEKLKAGVLSMDDEFSVSHNAWKKGGVHTGSSTMFLKPDHNVKVSDLLSGIVVQSGNDACIVAAENLAGSEKDFALEMNKKAEELGLTHSHFDNATGWPSKGQTMSLRDIATLSRIIITDFPEYYPIFSQQYFTYNKIKQENRNPLLTVAGIHADGLKTGHTEESGYGLVASAVDDETGRRIIMVVNGLSSMKERADETKRLITWGIKNFTNSLVFSKGMQILSIPVFMGEKQEVAAVAANDLILTHPKTGKNKIKASISYEKPLQAPIRKGDVIGKITITAPDITPKEIPVLAAENVAKIGWIGRLWYKIKYIIGIK